MTIPDDKIAALFPDRASAAPIPPNSAVIEALQEMLAEALSGKIVGIAVCCYDPGGACRIASLGQVTYTQIVAGLEKLKFETMLSWRTSDDRDPR